MRQRRVKDLDIRLDKLKHLYVTEPKSKKGLWKDLFEELRQDRKERRIFLEIGCGKGSFIRELAKRYPEDNFIAIEAQPSVILMAMEKANSDKLDNLIFIQDHIKDIRDYFENGEISGIYLNFSDPWHKKRHAKRRLTHRKFLDRYREIMGQGFIKMKTDNDNLFNFTIDELSDVSEKLDMKIVSFTRDLHISPYSEGNIMTEYESKFSSRGKNINYVNISVGGHKINEDSVRER